MQTGFGYRVSGGVITGVLGFSSTTPKNLFLPVSIPFNAWSYIACQYNSDSDLQWFVNGIYIGSMTALDSGGGSYGAFAANGGVGVAVTHNIDEHRVTQYPRFLSGAPVPTESFKDQ
jgi:hypothetical protein